MKHAIFAVVAITLAVWYDRQPDVAIYVLMFLVGAGLRAIFDLVDDWRRR